MTKAAKLSAVVERDMLVTALTTIARVIEKRNTIPILDNLHIQSAANKLILTGTDLGIFLELAVPAEIKSIGAITVNAVTLSKLVKNIATGPVTLDATADRITITAGRSKLELPVLPVEDYPLNQVGKQEVSFEIDPSVLHQMINTVKLAISTEQTRYYLNGIYFHTLGKQFRAVTTDGHRAAVFSTDTPAGIGEAFPEIIGQNGIILPRKTCLELLNLLKNKTDAVTVTIYSGENTRARFKHLTFDLTSKLIDGTFPDYQRVIPSKGTPLTFNVEKFSATLARVSAISARNFYPVKLAVTPNSITLSVSDPEKGTASETIDATWAVKPPAGMKIGFNAAYLRDQLAQIDGETACFWLQDSGSPIRITDPNDDRVVFVLMPMRV